MGDESPVKKYRSMADIMRVTTPLPNHVDAASSENGLEFKRGGYGEKLKGVGKPYAPVNWPNRGDKWSWRTGKRILPSGYYMDRYLYPPQHLRDAMQRRRVLDSKQEVRKFVISTSPGTNIDAFFASFDWRIPSHQIGGPRLTEADENAPHEETVVNAPPEVNVPATCKAGNGTCSSLAEDEVDSSLLMPCNVCSAVPQFCRHCTCIFCEKAVSEEPQGLISGFNHVRCENLVDGLICGHVAHIMCARMANLAGTVEGSVGLDAEFKCRSCDLKTDLVPYAEKILKMYESLNPSPYDVNANIILAFGITALRHSTRPRAQQLYRQFRVYFDSG